MTHFVMDHESSTMPAIKILEELVLVADDTLRTAMSLLNSNKDSFQSVKVYVTPSQILLVTRPLRDVISKLLTFLIKSLQSRA